MKNGQFNKHPVFVGVVALTIFVIAGIWSILAFIGYERQRALAGWQLTLGIMADSKSNTILRWVDSRFVVLNELAANGSLQLYIQHLHTQTSQSSDTASALLSHLRNLVRATAEREKFIDSHRTGPIVPANVAFQADSALILFDRYQKIITATPGMSIVDNALREAVSTVQTTGKPTLYDIHLNTNNQPIVGFITPVFALQPQDDQQEVIAVLVGLEHARNSLFPLFVSVPASMQSGETLLVRQDGSAIVYLSPLADNTPALKRRLAANAPDLAAAYAIEHPGSFAERRDYSGMPVLFVSRELTGTSWILMQKIAVEEALSEAKVYQQFLLISLLLILLLIAALLTAAWWYGSNVRERIVSSELRLKSRELTAQSQLLSAINNNIADFIFLVDAEMRVVFVNKTLAKQLAVFVADLKGKTLSSVLGPNVAGELTAFITSAIQSGTSIFQMKTFEINNTRFIFHITFIPVPYRETEYDTVLITLHDVTQLQKAREKQLRLSQQLVKAMMRAIDLHDPYSANHSAKTATVAIAVGRVMTIKQQEIDALKIAANLCNLGKLSIPRELLAKIGELSAEEQGILQKEINYAIDILSGIDLDEAIITTIAQKNELLDGSGYPQGLKNDEIIRTARILAAANAFVAMISPRGYRNKLPVQEALGQLMAAVDSKYDRQVVAALFHVVENEIDWSAWAS